MELASLVLLALKLFAFLPLVLLAGALIGTSIPAARRSSLRLLRGGIFAALCSAALYILVSVILARRLGSVGAVEVYAAAALGFNVSALIFFVVELLRPVRASD